jgi:hypothetical protein
MLASDKSKRLQNLSVLKKEIKINGIFPQLK